MEQLNEVKRNQLVSKSKAGEKTKSYGTTRFQRRLKSKIPNNSSSYNNIDMNKLFKDDILDANIKVIGETDIYNVIVSFSGVIEELKQLIEQRAKIDLNICVRAIVKAFDKNDIYINCSCPDHKFRFNFWSTINKYSASEQPEMRPADITNPNDNLGATCKHGALVLNKQVWILKVASVLNNYIKYMRLRNKRLYELIIYPALYGIEYNDQEEEDTQISGQMSIFNDENKDQEVNDEVNIGESE